MDKNVRLYITQLTLSLLNWFVLCNSVAWSQNLVPNSSFEEYTGLPCGFIGGLPLTPMDSNHVRFDNISNYLTNWYTPTSGTTDYWFFADTTQRYQNAKDCFAGASLDNDLPTKARTGLGYLGLYVSSQETGSDYREYAQVKLKQPLKANTFYHVSFFAQLSTNASYCTDRLGVLFSALPITRPRVVAQSVFGEPLLYTPQVQSPDYICQFHQWVEVSQCFQAVGGEEYLTIGNFFDDSHTPLRQTATVIGQLTAYYLVDDVSVEEVGGSNFLPQPHFLGPDTTLCPHQSFKISIPFMRGSVYWQGGDTSHTIIANQAGLYIAQVTVGNCKVSDTLQLRVIPTLNLLTDTTICRDDAITLIITSGVGQIRWEDNSTDSVRVVSQTGTYWVTTQTDQCIQSDTVHVHVLDCPGSVPNVFTPNKDGKNDTFYIKNIELIPWELTIYNRWGSLVYHTNQYHNEWEASSDPSGVYYYLLQERHSGKLLKGWVTVIR